MKLFPMRLAGSGAKPRVEQRRRIRCTEENPLRGETRVRLFRAAGDATEPLAKGVQAWDRTREAAFAVVMADLHRPGLRDLSLGPRLRAANFRGGLGVHRSALLPGAGESSGAVAVAALPDQPARPDELMAAVEIAGAAGGGEGGR